MPSALITGGAGFFGGLLKRDLLARGWRIVSIDLERDEDAHANLTSVRGDIRDGTRLDALFASNRFDAVFHCAAILAHAVRDRNFLWTSNVLGTRNVAEACKRHGVPKLVFTSSNCLWWGNFGRPIREEDEPAPVEIYGRSKWEAERILKEYTNDFQTVTIRCPTIMDAGRLGLLAILFEFIAEGRRVWVVGRGENRYQFIYAGDLIDACVKAALYPGSDTFHIGSDGVRPLRDVYQYVIDRAATGARVARLPKGPTLLAMRLAHLLNISPLGPYQYRMIAEDFAFDTSRIQERLGWRPTLTNEEMLWKTYEYYRGHREEIARRTDASAHRSAAKMGIIRVLKWMS